MLCNLSCLSNMAKSNLIPSWLEPSVMREKRTCREHWLLPDPSKPGKFGSKQKSELTGQ